MRYLSLLAMLVGLPSFASSVKHPSCRIQVPQEATLLQKKSVQIAIQAKGYELIMLESAGGKQLPLSAADYVAYTSWYSLSNNSCVAEVRIVLPYSETAQTKLLDYRLSYTARELAKNSPKTPSTTDILCERATLEVISELPTCERR